MSLALSPVHGSHHDFHSPTKTHSHGSRAGGHRSLHLMEEKAEFPREPGARPAGEPSLQPSVSRSESPGAQPGLEASPAAAGAQRGDGGGGGLATLCPSEPRCYKNPRNDDCFSLWGGVATGGLIVLHQR